MNIRNLFLPRASCRAIRCGLSMEKVRATASFTILIQKSFNVPVPTDSSWFGTANAGESTPPCPCTGTKPTILSCKSAKKSTPCQSLFTMKLWGIWLHNIQIIENVIHSGSRVLAIARTVVDRDRWTSCSFFLQNHSLTMYTLGMVCNANTKRWVWADGSQIDYKPAVYNEGWPGPMTN